MVLAFSAQFLAQNLVPFFGPKKEPKMRPQRQPLFTVCLLGVEWSVLSLPSVMECQVMSRHTRSICAAQIAGSQTRTAART